MGSKEISDLQLPLTDDEAVRRVVRCLNEQEKRLKDQLSKETDPLTWGIKLRQLEFLEHFRSVYDI